MLGNLNAALLLLDSALEEIENGFVACERCGDQEETKNLDFVDDLKAAKCELLAVARERIKGYESMKQRIFRRLLKNHSPGERLTKVQLAVRIALFPMQWLNRNYSPYCPLTDTWSIHGSKYSGEALYYLATAQGETFKITQVNGVTHLTRASATDTKELT